MNPLIILLVEAGLKFGPKFVLDIIAIIKNKDATVADVETLFAKVLPYESYGIPEVVPEVKK